MSSVAISDNPLPLLTIAGSDSGGAAGLQADLKTWAALGAYGMSAVAAVTAQNSERVAAVHYLSPDFVAAQIDVVLSDYGAAAVKTGFLGRADIIEAVARRLAHWRGASGSGFETRPYIIDPVLVNHRGGAMFGPEVAAAYRELLFPLADLITPNAAEARLLGVMDIEQGSKKGGYISSAGEISSLQSLGAARVLLKGLRRGDEIVDVYWNGREAHELPQPRIDTANTHGSGDTLSAAICAFVAMGHEWPEAIRRAQAYTHAAIRRGAGWAMGGGHGPLGHGPLEH